MKIILKHKGAYQKPCFDFFSDEEVDLSDTGYYFNRCRFVLSFLLDNPKMKYITSTDSDYSEGTDLLINNLVKSGWEIMVAEQ